MDITIELMDVLEWVENATYDEIKLVDSALVDRRMDLLMVYDFDDDENEPERN